MCWIEDHIKMVSGPIARSPGINGQRGHRASHRGHPQAGRPWMSLLNVLGLSFLFCPGFCLKGVQQEGELRGGASTFCWAPMLLPCHGKRGLRPAVPASPGSLLGTQSLQPPLRASELELGLCEHWPGCWRSTALRYLGHRGHLSPGGGYPVALSLCESACPQPLPSALHATLPYRG